MKSPCLSALPFLTILLGACAALPPISAADPAAATPPVVYRSALGAAVAEGSEAPLSWRAANEEMQRVGGHVGHAPSDEEAGGAAASQKR